jgi:hypothetical protein
VTSVIDVRERVEAELASIQDDVVREGLRSFLVEPELHVREWDYGRPGTVFECWYVAKAPATGFALVYSDHGFGPGNPWGIVRTSDRAIGMDAGWFLRLEDAFVDSFGEDFPVGGHAEPQESDANSRADGGSMAALRVRSCQCAPS